MATDIEKANFVYNNQGEIGIDLTFTGTFVNEKVEFNLASGNILYFAIYIYIVEERQFLVKLLMEMKK